MKLSKVALQLYTLRDFCGSAKDLATSLKKVKAIGYDGVEFVRSDFASNRDLRKLADDNGLAISSIHEDGDRLLNHPQRVAEELTDLGTDLAVYAYPTGIDFQKGAEVDRLIQQLQHSSEAFVLRPVWRISRNGSRLCSTASAMSRVFDGCLCLRVGPGSPTTARRSSSPRHLMRVGPGSAS